MLIDGDGRLQCMHRRSADMRIRKMPCEKAMISCRLLSQQSGRNDPHPHRAQDGARRGFLRGNGPFLRVLFRPHGMETRPTEAGEDTESGVP